MQKGAIPAFLGADPQKRRVMMSNVAKRKGRENWEKARKNLEKKDLIDKHGVFPMKEGMWKQGLDCEHGDLILRFLALKVLWLPRNMPETCICWRSLNPHSLVVSCVA